MDDGGFSVAVEVTIPGTCLCCFKEGGVSKKEVLEVIKKYRELARVADTLRRM